MRVRGELCVILIVVLFCGHGSHAAAQDSPAAKRPITIDDYFVIERYLEKAEQAAEDLKRSAEQAVQNEVTEARKALKDEVAEQAAVIAQELIVKNLTADDQVKIIENYLDKVGAVQ